MRAKALIIFIDVRITHERVCTLGFTDISVPVMELGSGKPRVSLIAGIHGNETSSLLVIDKLLQDLPQGLKGTLQIILSANPLALAENTRTNGVDRHDLNRIFPGDQKQTLTHRLADSVLRLVRGSDVVIDLHTFDMQTPLMGILLRAHDTVQTAKCAQVMRHFAPEQVWVLDATKKDELQFGKALGSILNDLKIPNIAVEMNNPEAISDDQIDQCVQGVQRVLSAQGLIYSKMTTHAFPWLDRLVITAAESGIFIPHVKPLDTIKEGETIGILRILPSCSSIPIIAHREGIVMQVLRKRFVIGGQELIAIGKRVEV